MSREVQGTVSFNYDGLLAVIIHLTAEEAAHLHPNDRVTITIPEGAQP